MLFRDRKELKNYPINKVIVVRNPNVPYRIVNGQLLLSPGYTLNETGTFIWSMIEDSGATIKELHNALCKEFKIPYSDRKKVLEDLIFFLWELYVRGSIYFKLGD
jgi:hypothetical protein